MWIHLPSLLCPSVALGRVAGLARGNDVVGCVGSALREGYDVILLHLPRRAAVGARVVEPSQDGFPLVNGECGGKASGKSAAAGLSHRFFQSSFGRSVALFDNLLVVPALFFPALLCGASVGSTVNLPRPFGIRLTPLGDILAGAFGAIVLAVIPLVGRQTVVDFGRHGSSPRYHLRGELYQKQGVQ